MCSSPSLSFTFTHLFVIYLSSAARMTVTNNMGGFLYHLNGDICSIYGACFILAAGRDVTPAYLEKQPKSEAVSQRQGGGDAVDNSLQWNEASVQKAQFKFNQPTQTGPAIIVHEWTDRLSGCIFLCDVSISLILSSPQWIKRTDGSALTRLVQRVQTQCA